MRHTMACRQGAAGAEQGHTRGEPGARREASAGNTTETAPERPRSSPPSRHSRPRRASPLAVAIGAVGPMVAGEKWRSRFRYRAESRAESRMGLGSPHGSGAGSHAGLRIGG